VSEAEIKIKEKIDEMIRIRAELSVTDELPDSDHGYVDALIWLKEGSIQLTNEGIKKEMGIRKYADPDQCQEYYDGYESALKAVQKVISDIKE